MYSTHTVDGVLFIQSSPLIMKSVIMENLFIKNRLVIPINSR